MENHVWKEYRDFHINFQRLSSGLYQVDAQGPAGEAHAPFHLPFDEKDLKIFLLEVGRPRSIVSRGRVPEPLESSLKFGRALFNAMFTEQVRDLYISSRMTVKAEEKGLRLRLRFSQSPELANLPWEFLNDGSDFIALSSDYPLVRYLDLPSPPRPALVEMPLRILVTIAAPLDLPPLDAAAEKERLLGSFKNLIDAGRVEVEFSPDASLIGLQRILRKARSERKPFHVWHFIGHGSFDAQTNSSMLALVNSRGGTELVSGYQIGTLFESYPEVRLVLLNACEGARTSLDDPFSGVAAALVESGIPAVIAMQFEISDQAAIILTEEFYAALVDGLPIDAALTEARRAVFFMPNWVEWATPVLFMRSPNGILFEFSAALPPKPEVKPDPQVEEPLSVPSAVEQPASRLRSATTAPATPSPTRAGGAFPTSPASEAVRQPEVQPFTASTTSTKGVAKRFPAWIIPSGIAALLVLIGVGWALMRAFTPMPPLLTETPTLEHTPVIPIVIVSPEVTAEVVLQQGGLTEIYVDASAQGANDGTRWEDAFTDLQSALGVAASGSKIRVARGIYKPGSSPEDTFRLMSGVELFGGYDPAAGIVMDDQRDWQKNLTILNGDIDGDDGGQVAGLPDDFNLINGRNSYHVVSGNGVDSSAILDGFYITAGQANGSDWPDNTGGGIFLAESSPKIMNLIVQSNMASGDGGGFGIVYGSPEIKSVYLTYNYAATSGGGMMISGGSPVLSFLIFDNNQAIFGGGMYNLDTSPVITSSEFTRNYADYGGGMYNNHSSPQITASAFSENSAGTDGGGMYNGAGSLPTLIGGEFTFNTAQNGGGGMCNVESSPSLVQVSFDKNKAVNGGGMRNHQQSNPVMDTVEFIDNEATYGGGILNSDSSPVLITPTFINNVISDMDPACSMDRGDPITIHLQNLLEQPVRIYWIESNCTEHYYSEIGPGESSELSTYKNDVWKFYNSTTNELLRGVIASVDQIEVKFIPR